MRILIAFFPSIFYNLHFDVEMCKNAVRIVKQIYEIYARDSLSNVIDKVP
jgi:hypothetical protein